MLIQNTSIIISYKKIEGLKRAYYTNEELLKSHFNEATTLPVPDEAPVEIPRIITSTHHEHAQLSISPVMTTFEVTYNDGFETQWDKCEDYIRERMATVFDFINVMTSDRYNFIGVITNLLYDEIEDNGTKQIADVLLNAKEINGIHDINIKYTFIEKEKYYHNISLQNARVYEDEVDDSIAGSLNTQNQQAESVGVQLDLNDRYGFNNSKNYCSKSSVLDDLLSSMGAIISNKLQSLIEKGVY